MYFIGWSDTMKTINRACGGDDVINTWDSLPPTPRSNPWSIRKLLWPKAENLFNHSGKKSMQQLCHGGACLNNPAR